MTKTSSHSDQASIGGQSATSHGRQSMTASTPGGESQKGNDVTDRITEGMEGREGEGPAAIRDFSEAESLRSSYRNVALFFRGVLNKAACVGTRGARWRHPNRWMAFHSHGCRRDRATARRSCPSRFPGRRVLRRAERYHIYLSSIEANPAQGHCARAIRRDRCRRPNRLRPWGHMGRG